MIETNYTIKQEAGTSGSAALLMGSLLIKPILFAGIASAAPIADNIVEKSYFINEAPRTFGQLSNPFGRELDNSASEFEGVVTAFYASLLKNQQPLGKEFEDVLNENLWDLYIRS